MENDSTKQFQDKLETALKREFNRGVQIGSAAISKLILEKLSDRKLSLPQRITEIKKLCSVPIRNLKDDTEDKR